MVAGARWGARCACPGCIGATAAVDGTRASHNAAHLACASPYSAGRLHHAASHPVHSSTLHPRWPHPAPCPSRPAPLNAGTKMVFAGLKKPEERADLIGKPPRPTPSPPPHPNTPHPAFF